MYDLCDVSCAVIITQFTYMIVNIFMEYDGVCVHNFVYDSDKL